MSHLLPVLIGLAKGLPGGGLTIQDTAWIRKMQGLGKVAKRYSSVLCRYPGRNTWPKPEAYIKTSYPFLLSSRSRLNSLTSSSTTTRSRYTYHESLSHRSRRLPGSGLRPECRRPQPLCLRGVCAVVPLRWKRPRSSYHRPQRWHVLREVQDLGLGM